MKKLRIFLFIIIFLSYLGSIAMANGFSLNSLGSKAASMGGAFVGLADDYSAIFWNPAGIAQFDKKYFGFNGIDLIPSASFELEAYFLGIGNIKVVDANTQSKHYLGGLVAYYHPINQNLVAGISIYSPSVLGFNWDGKNFSMVARDNSSINWKSKVGIVTISPALAFKISNKISIGATINMNYGRFNLAMYTGYVILPLPKPPYFEEIDLGQYDENLGGWGYGATLGLLFRPIDIFSLGVALRTSSTITFKGDASISNFPKLGTATGKDISQISKAIKKITWPLWLGVGVRITPIESLTFTFDLHWTQWSKINVIETDYKDTFWKFFMALRDRDKMLMDWKDTLQFRFGAEYRVNKISFRGGFYIDPSPTPDITMNFIYPTFTFDVFTFGIGYNFKEFQIDFGLEYQRARERNTLPGAVKVWPFDYEPGWQPPLTGSYDMNIVTPSVSMSYRF